MTNQEKSRYAKAIYEMLLDVDFAPSGHIYAALMNKMNLDEYTEIISILKELKLITESHHALSAVRTRGQL